MKANRVVLDEQLRLLRLINSRHSKQYAAYKTTWLVASQEDDGPCNLC